MCLRCYRHLAPKDNEIHVKTTMVNGVELLYVGKKQADDDDLQGNDCQAKSNYCSLL